MYCKKINMHVLRHICMYLCMYTVCKYECLSWSDVVFHQNNVQILYFKFQRLHTPPSFNEKSRHNCTNIFHSHWRFEVSTSHLFKLHILPRLASRFVVKLQNLLVITRLALRFKMSTEKLSSFNRIM